MLPKQLFMEFVEVILDVLLILFFVYYIIVLRNMALAKAIVFVMTPIAIFALFLLIKAKQAQEEFRELDKKATLDEVVYYVQSSDIFTDQAMMILSIVVISLVSFLYSFFDYIDIWQIVFFLLPLIPWHYYFFIYINKDIGYAAITRGKHIFDELVVFMIPIYLLLPPVIFKKLEVSDIIQMFAALFVMFAWRKVLYARSNKL